MYRKVASEHGRAPVFVYLSPMQQQGTDDTTKFRDRNPDWRVTIGSTDPPSTERHQAGSESLNPAALLPQSAHSLPVPLPTNHPHAARQRPPTTRCKQDCGSPIKSRVIVSTSHILKNPMEERGHGDHGSACVNCQRQASDPGQVVYPHLVRLGTKSLIFF